MVAEIRANRRCNGFLVTKRAFWWQRRLSGGEADLVITKWAFERRSHPSLDKVSLPETELVFRRQNEA